MRLNYAPESPSPSATESEKEIYSRIAARRAPRPVTKLDRALLHSPPVANGWNELLGAIRTKTSLSQADSELAVCRVAVLNGANYEWFAHAPLAVKAGVKTAVLRTVRDTDGGVFQEGAKARVEEYVKEGGEGLSRKEWLIVAYTDQMTKRVTVEDGLFEMLKEEYDGDERMVVELTATIAAYNCVSRFLVALDVCEMNDGHMQIPEEDGSYKQS